MRQARAAPLPWAVLSGALAPQREQSILAQPVWGRLPEEQVWVVLADLLAEHRILPET